jgi:hypothetical protein
MTSEPTTERKTEKVSGTLGPTEIGLLGRIYEKTGGAAWEPRSGTHTPFFDRAIAAGYVRRVDGRCGFERFKESHIAFTQAGHAALATHPAKEG